ncbi:TonB-linked outer membrane protein, SusC/RagA family [Pedobacter caeni]|uniref:TonB-linked outer membrane protein, SusC/RagA family n=2 Tax=Pedobacter caeni TaxID=288992 RepID=A0A1M5IQA9_9SPHI|nr:TonB-linked outer membrane protein, SusC/RagA family [Pedobacter caeni]
MKLNAFYPGMPKIWLPLKLLLIMKLTIFILILSLVNVYASTFGQKVNLEQKNVPLKVVLNAIEAQTGYVFFSRDYDLNKPKISVSLKNVTIYEAIKSVFNGLPVEYKIVDNNIILKGNAKNISPAFNVARGAQDTLQIRGNVADKTGKPLPGTSVILKGTKIGTTTDDNGNYALRLPDGNGTLVFKFIGFQTKEEPVSGRKLINVVLNEDDSQLQEIVVVGYATKDKSSVTGAISQADKKVFESRPLVNASSALQGAVSGLTVVRSSGQPGRQGYDLQIRGFSSVNGNKPLVLIDGVPGDLNSLNPNDIGTVTVLKDAAASIYGARAADGVVLITTKNGVKGPPQVDYSANFGLKTPDYLKNVTTTQQLAEMSNEALLNVGLPGVPEEVFTKIRQGAPADLNKGWVTYLQDYPGFYTDNNWNKILYGNALQQTHNISVTGGGENSAYLFSAGYANDNGVFKYGKNNSDRYNLRMNYDFKLLDKINVQTRNSFNNEIVREPSSLADVMSNSPRLFNFVPLRNTTGQYYTYQGYINPVQQLEEGGMRESNSNAFSFNVKADVEILKGLKITGQAGVNTGNYNDNANTRTFTLYDYEGNIDGYRNPLNSAYYANSRNLFKSYTGLIEYAKVIGNHHNLSLMAGTSFEKNTDLGTDVTGSNFSGNEIFTFNLADQTKADYTKLNGFNTDWALNSYFGRFSYGFKNKLFLDATVRLDGSSKFSPDKRWSAAFPGVSVAYNLSEEKFIKSLNVISNLKVRASWGQAGNQEIKAFSNYGYIPLIKVSGGYPFGSPNARFPGAVSGIASDKRTWETIETANVGVDFGFLDNRLTGSIDVYNKENRNMLVNVQVPATLGGTPPSQNQGHLVTKGFDFSLGWKDQIGQVKYSVTAILNDSKNKLVELKGNDVLTLGHNFTHQGYSLNSYFGYDFAGIIQNAEQLATYKKLGGVPNNIAIGDVMYNDLDGDGNITPYGDPAKGTKGDLLNLGNTLPRYTFSANLNLSYSNFDLSVMMQGVGKQMNIRDGSFSVPMSAIYFQSLEYFYGKSWTPENTAAPYPRLIPGAVGFDNLLSYNWRYSSMRVNNLAYLRFKVITIGYNVPELLCKKLKLKGIRLYASGQDLFTISKGTWNGSFDPEEGYKTNTEQTYPFTRVTSIGLNVKF